MKEQKLNLCEARATSCNAGLRDDQLQSPEVTSELLQHLSSKIKDMKTTLY